MNQIRDNRRVLKLWAIILKYLSLLNIVSGAAAAGSSRAAPRAVRSLQVLELAIYL